MTILEKIAPEVKGIISAGGWEIVKHDIERWESGAIKVLTGKATEEEKQEVIYLSTIRLPDVMGKLTAWYKGIGFIVNVQEEEKKKKKEV